MQEAITLIQKTITSIEASKMPLFDKRACFDSLLDAISLLNNNEKKDK